MPWQEMSIVDRRREFAMLASLPGSNMAELCRRFGISRPTGYKWLRRSGEGESFEDRSRRPRSSPGRTAAATETAVLALRASHRHGRLALGRHPFRARRENAEGRPRPRQGLQPEIDIWTTLPELCKGLVRALAIWTTLPLRGNIILRKPSRLSRTPHRCSAPCTPADDPGIDRCMRSSSPCRHTRNQQGSSPRRPCLRIGRNNAPGHHRHRRPAVAMPR